MPTDIITPETATLILACAGAINRQLHKLVELQNAQIKVLKRTIGKRPRASDAEKRKLAAMAHDLSRAILELGEHIVTVDSLRRWHRQLIANTYTSHRRGRPRIAQELEDLILRLANDNPHWGEDSIADRCRDLGFEVSDRTVGNTLRRNGVPPAPERETTCNWERFIEINWHGLIALDMACHHIPNAQGTRTTRHYAIYAIHLDTREVRLLGVTSSPTARYMHRMAINLTDMIDGFALGKTKCIMDNDEMWHDAFRKPLADIGCELVKIPPNCPKCNAYIERFIGTTRREIGRDFLPLNAEQLEYTLRQHVIYYNQERNHQALAGHHFPIKRYHDNLPKGDGRIVRSSRLGKAQNFYYREAA